MLLEIDHYQGAGWVERGLVVGTMALHPASLIMTTTGLVVLHNNTLLGYLFAKGIAVYVYIMVS